MSIPRQTNGGSAAATLSREPVTEKPRKVIFARWSGTWPRGHLVAVTGAK